MKTMDWKQVVEQWRRLSAQEQLRIRLSRIPRKVARSMAFAGEPVEEPMLEEELRRRVESRLL